jgi:hypothetical protein
MTPKKKDVSLSFQKGTITPPLYGEGCLHALLRKPK